MEILGIHVDNLTMSEALQKIQGFLEDRRQHYIVTINPEFIVRAQKDDDFRKILNQANLAIPDGTGIIWASRWLGEPLKERVAGTDLVERIMNRESGIRDRIFLLGGRGGVAEKIAGQWLKIAGFAEDTENAELFARIRQCQPNILLVALGAPKQEKWIADNLAKVPSVKLAIGVGGAFDFLSQKIKRAPVFMQKIGLEWLWRFMKEPKRLPRIFRATIIFPLLVLRHSYIRKNS